MEKQPTEKKKRKTKKVFQKKKIKTRYLVVAYWGLPTYYEEIILGEFTSLEHVKHAVKADRKEHKFRGEEREYRIYRLTGDLWLGYCS